MMRVLVIDDDVQIRKLLKITLENQGYKVYLAAGGQEGLQLIPGIKPELILLDLNLPDGDGIHILKTLRTWSPIPVIVLSVRNTEEDIVELLNNGADDYMIKPFNTGELLARIGVSLRHSIGVQKSDDNLQFKDISMEISTRRVLVRGSEVKLTPTEYAILKLFLSHQGKILTHHHILQAIWGPNGEQESGSLRVHINQIRKKIEENPAIPSLLITEPGVGYRLARS